MSTQAVDGIVVATVVFVGFPAGWTLIWAFVRFVNRRCPRGEF